MENAIIDHIAIATSDWPQLEKVLAILGLQKTGTEPVPSQGVVTHFHVAAPAQTAVELLEPTDPQGVIAKFLQKRGPGIHHFCVRVGDIEGCSAKLRAQGIRLVYDTAQNGAHSRKVNFVHPSSTGGVLIEISQ
jgi:methylmalonyl-CoA epimerase